MNIKTRSSHLLFSILLYSILSISSLNAMSEKTNNMSLQKQLYYRLKQIATNQKAKNRVQILSHSNQNNNEQYGINQLLASSCSILEINPCMGGTTAIPSQIISLPPTTSLPPTSMDGLQNNNPKETLIAIGSAGKEVVQFVGHTVKETVETVGSSIGKLVDELPYVDELKRLRIDYARGIREINDVRIYIKDNILHVKELEESAKEMEELVKKTFAGGHLFGKEDIDQNNNKGDHNSGAHLTQSYDSNKFSRSNFVSHDGTRNVNISQLNENLQNIVNSQEKDQKTTYSTLELNANSYYLGQKNLEEQNRNKILQDTLAENHLKNMRNMDSERKRAYCEKFGLLENGYSKITTYEKITYVPMVSLKEQVRLNYVETISVMRKKGCSSQEIENYCNLHKIDQNGNFVLKDIEISKPTVLSTPITKLDNEPLITTITPPNNEPLITTITELDNEPCVTPITQPEIQINITTIPEKPLGSESLIITQENNGASVTKSPYEIIQDIIDESEVGKETGLTQQYSHSGNFDGANKYFDDLQLTDVEDRGNGLRTGTLPDGRTVVVRPFSSNSKGDGSFPTLEIQSRKGYDEKAIKFRFKGEKSVFNIPSVVNELNTFYQKKNIQGNSKENIKLTLKKSLDDVNKTTPQMFVINGKIYTLPNKSTKQNFTRKELDDFMLKSFDLKNFNKGNLSHYIIVNDKIIMLPSKNEFNTIKMINHQSEPLTFSKNVKTNKTSHLQNKMNISPQNKGVILSQITQKNINSIDTTKNFTKKSNTEKSDELGHNSKNENNGTQTNQNKKNESETVKKKESLDSHTLLYQNNYNDLGEHLEKNARAFDRFSGMVDTFTALQGVNEIYEQIDTEYKKSGCYLSKKHQELFDALLSTNKIKVDKYKRKKLERELAFCVISSPETKECLENWNLSKSIHNDCKPDSEIEINNLDEFFKYINDRYAKYRDMQATKLYQDSKSKIDSLYKNNGTYLTNYHKEILDNALSVNKIKLTEEQRKRIERQLALNFAMNPAYQMVFEMSDFTLTKYDNNPNDYVIRNIEDVFIAIQQRLPDDHATFICIDIPFENEQKKKYLSVLRRSYKENAKAGIDYKMGLEEQNRRLELQKREQEEKERLENEQKRNNYIESLCKNSVVKNTMKLKANNRLYVLWHHINPKIGTSFNERIVERQKNYDEQEVQAKLEREKELLELKENHTTPLNHNQLLFKEHDEYSMLKKEKNFYDWLLRGDSKEQYNKLKALVEQRYKTTGNYLTPENEEKFHRLFVRNGIRYNGNITSIERLQRQFAINVLRYPYYFKGDYEKLFLDLNYDRDSWLSMGRQLQDNEFNQKYYENLVKEYPYLKSGVKNIDEVFVLALKRSKASLEMKLKNNEIRKEDADVLRTSIEKAEKDHQYGFFEPIVIKTSPEFDKKYSTAYKRNQDLMEVEHRRLQEKVENEFKTNGYYLNKDDLEKLSNLILINKVKTSEKRFLELQKECAINLLKYPYYLKDDYEKVCMSAHQDINNDEIKSMNDLFISSFKRSKACIEKQLKNNKITKKDAEILLCAIKKAEKLDHFEPIIAHTSQDFSKTFSVDCKRELNRIRKICNQEKIEKEIFNDRMSETPQVQESELELVEELQTITIDLEKNNEIHEQEKRIIELEESIRRCQKINEENKSTDLYKN